MLSQWEQEGLERQTWLRGLKIGDEVCIPTARRSSYTIITISAETPTQWKAGGTRIRKTDGLVVGSCDDYYGSLHVRPVTDIDRLNINRRRLLHRFHNLNRECAFEKLNLAQMEFILAILAQPKPEGERP